MPLNIRGSNCRASSCTLSKNTKPVCAFGAPWLLALSASIERKNTEELHH